MAIREKETQEQNKKEWVGITESATQPEAIGGNLWHASFSIIRMQVNANDSAGKLERVIYIIIYFFNSLFKIPALSKNVLSNIEKEVTEIA